MIEKIFKKISDISNETELMHILSTIGSEYENLLDDQYKRKNGIYYTSLPLATHMVDELFQNLDLKKIGTYKFLEPCVGVGNFVFAYLLKIKTLKLKDNCIEKILKNIYVADIDKNALNIYVEMLKKISEILFNIEITSDFLKGHVANGLMINLEIDNFHYIQIHEVFPEVMSNGGFDIIITNPPYKNLKAEKNKYENVNLYLKDKRAFEKISKFAKSHFKYVNKGVLNIYKLFVEEIITQYSSKNAVISLLIPSSILTDLSCKHIRKYLLQNHCIQYINVIEENAGYINALQGLASILVIKNQKQNNIKINASFTKSSGGKYSEIRREIIMNGNYDYSIFSLNSEDYIILDRLNQFPKIGKLNFLHNLRGELDLTIDKESIVYKKTDLKLVRGRHISYYRTNEIDLSEYVDLGFIKRSSKSKYIAKTRIACQQIANMKKERRITFSLLEPNFVLANSCNFLVIDNNPYNIDIFTVLGIMNSTLINWLFKLTSSNNHINNYELDMLPFPLNAPNLKKIGLLTREYLQTSRAELLTEIDQEVNYAYTLNQNLNTETKPHLVISSRELLSKFTNDFNLLDNYVHINELEAERLLNENISLESFITQHSINQKLFLKKVIEGLVIKYRKLIANNVLNHETAKLSELDLQMIKNVPQGGNWKNIPQNIVAKSKRLQRISETGGRTTLYGRIDYSKPAYTITTYFNRPGNGTYVHPTHDRVISGREAARFQSFPDDYYFYGSKADILKQIGNAVPPILAYQLGKRLIEHKITDNVIDLFAGAGGLTVGLKNAGIKTLASIDNYERSCVTLKINNPEINVISGDIKSNLVKNELYSLVANKKVDLICGGPPCQGFSYAGKRFIDDPRNSLFREYVEIVSVLKPKVFILENVPGILTLAKGMIYREIIELFSKLGYVIEGKLLIASEYSVPQKRKRLIVIGTRADINLPPSTLFPVPNLNNVITAKEAIFDLEQIKCGSDVTYTMKETKSEYIKALSNEISIQEFLNNLKSKNQNQEVRYPFLKTESVQLSLLG